MMIVAGCFIPFPVVYKDNGGILEILWDSILLPNGMKQVIQLPLEGLCL